MNIRRLAVGAFIVLLGCTTSSGVVPMGQDTYMISRTEKGFRGSSSKVKAEALKEANEYCAGQGKVLLLTKTDQRDMVPFKSDAQAEVQFMCLSQGDSRLTSDSDKLIEIRR